VIIRQHHERFDGFGYPDRLVGQSIRVGARILAVCDSWAAMLADRPYQARMSQDRARQELTQGRGGQFDPDVVDVVLDLHERGRIGLPGRMDASLFDGQPEQPAWSAVGPVGPVSPAGNGPVNGPVLWPNHQPAPNGYWAGPQPAHPVSTAP